MSNFLQSFKISEASSEYKQRRKTQMLKFFTASAITILTSRFAYRSTIARQYVPTLFQGNHSPPLSYNFTTDAAVAVATGTVLCGSVSSMIILGGFWVLDVLNLSEFGWRMKEKLGGLQKEKELGEMKMDDESRYIQDSLNDLLDGKYDFDEEGQEVSNVVAK